MTISPNSESSHSEALDALWQNWRGEWMGLLNAARSWLLVDDHALITLDFSAPDGLCLEQNGVVLGRLEKDDARDSHAIASILGKGGSERGFDAVLLLPRRELLSRRIELPFMSMSSLKGALQYELERLTPLPPDRLYFDFLTHMRDRKTNRAVIDVRLIKREVVDEAVVLAHGAGGEIAAFRFDGEMRDAEWRNFPVDRGALLRHIWRRFGLVLCSGLAALLLVVLLIAAYARGASINAVYTDQIEGARRDAAAIALLDQRIRTAKLALSFPVQQKSQPLVTATLANLTQALPDNSWIGDFELSGKQLRLRGTSQSASDLIAALDRSGHFNQATFTAPIVRNSQDKNDHFDLTANVVGGAP